jgi:hypothetical protein
MSLNRDQWVAMWDNVKEMEHTIKFATEMSLVKRQRLLNKINKIKADIESVIGQME